YSWIFFFLAPPTSLIYTLSLHDALPISFKPSYVSGDNSFLTRHNNWNPVCNGGLVYAALAIFEDEQEQATAIIERALESSKLPLDRKSTRLNSSHVKISYAVFCLKKKNK